MTFQCDLYTFRLLIDRNPVFGAEKDELLLCCIRCLNLDVLWSREPGALYGNFLNTRENLNLWSLVGVLLERLLLAMGPFPFKDVLRYMVMVNMILKILKVGQYTG